MPTSRIAYVDQPLVMPRYTPDYSRLSALYTQGGDTLARLALQRGATTAATFDRLGALFSGFQQAQQQEKLAAAAVALRQQERADDRGEKEKDRSERKAERDASEKARKYEEDRGAARYMVEQAVPGPVDSALAQFARKFPETAARFSSQATLPATVTPGAAGEVDPAPQAFDVLNPSAQQLRQSALDAAAQRERDAAGARAAVDDKRQSDALAESIRHNKSVENSAAAKAAAEGADKTSLTAAGLDIAALNYRKTGVMPPLGMGDKHTRQDIINRAAALTAQDIARIESIADIAGNKQDYAANTDSLKSLQKSRDAIGAFEQTAQKNIDVFLDVAGKVVDTGSPLANRLAREVSGALLGSPDQAAYDAARQVAINEIAKITSNPTMAGQLSDSARHEVDAFNPRNATLAQSVRVMRLLKTEMQNRAKSLDEELAAVRARGKSAPATAPVVEEWTRDANGKLVKKGGA